MPRVAKALAAIEVGRLAHPGPPKKGNVAYPVGGVSGLHLQITPSGARSWILRTTIGDKRSEVGLGTFPAIPLAKAREKAAEIKDGIRDRGINPIEVRKEMRRRLIAERANSKTFEECAKAYIKSREGEWKNDKHAKQWSATLET
jgi:hypothetical protein